MDNFLSISLINKILEENHSNDTLHNINGNKEIIIKLEKINVNLDSLFKKRKIKEFFHVKFKKLEKLVELLIIKNKDLKIREFNDIEKEKNINLGIINISIIILINYINNNNHNDIRNYFKLLLLFLSSNILKINNLFLIINIILNSIIYKFKNTYKLFKLKNEPLLIINDIFEEIINYPIDLTDNSKFIDEIIKCFKMFLETIKKQNIFLEESEQWLKLLESKNIIKNEDSLININKNYSFDKMNDFLINIYKNNIPKNFYNEIFKTSAIDLPYYLNILNFLKKLFEKESDLENIEGFNIEKGINFSGNKLFYRNLHFNCNEFSLILSFKINKIKKVEEIPLFKIFGATPKGKHNILSIIIDKEQKLLILNNENSKWNTNIRIITNKFYFLYLYFNKSHKNITLYINEKENKDDDKEEKICDDKCNKYISEKVQYPNFYEKMIGKLGDEKFYGILGEILLINQELDMKSIDYLFNSKGKYPDLLCGNKNNYKLLNDKFVFSQQYKEAINHFKSLKYECIFRIMPNYFYPDNNLNKEKEIIEFKRTNSIEKFFKEKGIEFLSFMLHNIDTFIKDHKTYDLFLYKTIDFLYNAIVYYRKINGNNAYFEIEETDLNNQINAFFLTLLLFLNNKKDKQKNNYFSEDLRNSLANFFEIRMKSSNYYFNIIIGILFDDELFNRKENLLQLKTKIIYKLDNSIFNNEIIYNIFSLDSIYLSKNIKHKKFSNFINSLFSSNNKLFIKELAKYIINIKNEIKLYHYLKIIYYQLEIFINELDLEDKNEFLNFFEIIFQKLNNKHCKYCIYTLILCYLIKEEFFIKEKEKNLQNIDNNKYFISDSFLFIKAIFIKNFAIENNQKFRFIKAKNHSNFFENFKSNPIDLCNNKIFFDGFNSLMNYLNFLINSEEISRNIIDEFFLLIIEFIDKVVNIKTKNNKKNINLFIVELFKLSEDYDNFFIFYLNYNEEKALSLLKGYIKSYFDIFIIPLFDLINQKVKIGDKKKSDNVKGEIIKEIIQELINPKSEQNLPSWTNIYFLKAIYKNVCESHFQISKDFQEIFINYYFHILEIKLFLDRRPVVLSTKSEYKYIEDIKDFNQNDNSNIKFISEIFLEIIFQIFFNVDIQILDYIFINKNLHKIIFDNDIESIKNSKKINSKNSQYSSLNFKEEVNNILFTLYFIMIFFNKLNICENIDEERKNNITKILDILFKNLEKIYELKKITSILKEIQNYGINFGLYKILLMFCNKNHKEKNFNLNILHHKYNEIKRTNIKRRNKLNDDKNDNIFKINIFDISDKNNDEGKMILKEKNYEKPRNKSFDKLITISMKEKYLEKSNNDHLSYYQINIGRTTLNNSRLSNFTINNKEHNINIEHDLLNDETEEKNYLNKKLSGINKLNYYYQTIINNNNKNSNSLIKYFFNPKEYFIWKKFSIPFKDLLYKNKKFITLSKAFKIYIRNANATYSSENEKKNVLKYPSKIKNYIVDNYYRPFLKPSLNFFNNKYILMSHTYVKSNLLIYPQLKEDNFNLINFKRIIPNFENKNTKKMIYCEMIKNKGNIFGQLIFNNEFMIFENSPENDLRGTKNLKIALKYLYSTKEDAIIDKNKYIIIFYEDIKEIIRRRFCFYYIGYEIFMKDNSSYLFNFFEKENINFVSEIFNSHIQEKIKQEKNNEEEIKSNKNLKSSINNNLTNNNNSLNTKTYDYRLIEEPIENFKKMEYKNKYKKGELSNFDYLLLLNKYSSRSYNDNNQYLIFPLLFLDDERTQLRDLSKAISLNKINNNNFGETIKSNRNLLGYYFSQHYSTSGFILFYLVRQIPFTYAHIDLQSGKFDLSERLFSSMKNFLSFLDLIQENRELIPEFFFNYEFFLNLNYNNFGYIQEEEKGKLCFINNFITKDNETSFEFIIYLRNLLEQCDISPWIDNIFGAKQFSNTDDYPNSFATYSYEEFGDFDKIKEGTKSLKEKVDEIEQKVGILKFGITPAKIFNKPHPKINKPNRKNTADLEEEINISERKEEKIRNLINDYIKKKSKESFYVINSYNFNEIELIFKFNSKIEIIRSKFGENKINYFSFSAKDQIEFEPYNNLFCEVIPGIICVVRNRDKTIKFISQKKLLEEYKCTCIPTAIEPFKKKIQEEKNIKKVFIGDENGYLHLLKIEYLSSQNEKSSEIKSVKIVKTIKVQRSLIRGIIYNEKLNIIISWSDEGVICINNDYSFEFLNIIDLGGNCDIKEIIISKYDLLYISCYDSNDQKYKILCFNLNGVPVTSFESSKKIIRFFVEEKVNIVNEIRNIFSYKCYDFYKLYDIIYCEYIDNLIKNRIDIIYCCYYAKIKKMLILYNDNKIVFQKIDQNFI